MGTDATVRTQTNWKLPAGTAMASGQFVVEGPASPARGHRDTPGDWARWVNDLYDFFHPALVNDAFGTALVGGGVDTYSTIARYRLPAEFCGTGLTAAGDVEGLLLSVYGLTDNGALNPGTARVVTDSDSHETNQLDTAFHQWVKSAFDEENGKCDFYDGLDDGPTQGGDVIGAIQHDPEIHVDLKGLTDGSKVKVSALNLWMAPLRASVGLPDGPYHNDFTPCNVSEYATESRPLSVEKMERLLVNLDDLKRRRTPSMILASWLPTAAIDDSKGATKTSIAWRAPGFRPEYVTEARFYVYAEGLAPAPATGDISITFAGQTVTIPSITPSGYLWYRADFYLGESTARGTITVDDLSVQLSGCTAQGCCGWYRAISAPMGT